MLKIPAKMADAASQLGSMATEGHLFASALTVSMATLVKVKSLYCDNFRDIAHLKDKTSRTIRTIID